MGLRPEVGILDRYPAVETGLTWGALIVALLLPVLPKGLAAQAHDMAMHGGMSADSGAVWRMPPMARPMPMLPGLEGAVPPVTPWLAGQGMDPDAFPLARPSEIVRVADGDTVQLQASLVRRVIDGRTFVMYGYNGQYPGPLFRAEQGSTIVVEFSNQIESPTTVHWHGLRLDNRFDGVASLTQSPVEVGDRFTYELRFIDAGLYWYHPHLREDVQQDLGLYGNLVVDPRTPDYYNPVNREEMLVLDDLLVDAGGLVPWGEEAPTHALMGRFGNVLLVNGETGYELRVRRGDVVRFFVTNVANSRTFNLTFGDARTKVVASDVSRFEREAWAPSVPIAPAERYVVEVRFDKVGRVALTNAIQAIDHFQGDFYAQVDTLGFVEVVDEPAVPDFGDGFNELRTYEEVRREIAALEGHFDRAPDHRLELSVRVRDLPTSIMRSMEMDTLYVPPMEWNDAMPMMNWLSTGTQVTWILRDPETGRENMDIRWAHRVGDVIKVRIFNDPTSFHPMHHPIHVHGQRYLVLERDGVRNPNMAWKDTAVVPVGSTVDLLIELSNPGDWMVHCHIAEHLHAGMMLQLSVEAGEG